MVRIRRNLKYVIFLLTLPKFYAVPETNTSKDEFFQNIFLEEDFLGNRDSEMKKNPIFQ